jgi:hypothetical protein
MGVAAAQAAPGAMPRRKAKALSRDSLSAVSSTPAQVRERKLGDLFEYAIEHAVTIRRNQSALVPIVLRPFEGRPVLLHNRDTRPGNPMRCVEFKNTTGLTLEGGPVTVLEAGSYVGEAMLDTLKPDEERLVPYAVELGVRVLDNVQSHADRVHRVVLRDGRLTTTHVQAQQTTYHFDNRSDAEQTLYLDHPRGGAEWQLADTPAPRETTENHWRFRFALPARAVTPFVVHQRLTIEQRHNLLAFDTTQLGYWLEQRYLDAATRDALRQAIDAQHEYAALEARLKALGEERDRIHKEQARIRENLQALGDRSAEKELRERLVRTLGAQEDRLEQIAAEVQARTAERDACRQRLNALLAGLEFEATVA